MSLGRHVSSISLWTGMSRILGFLREILIARVFGAGGVVDAFFAAFTFPNLFRRVFGEGALNSAFVPLFGKQLEQNPEAAEAFAQRTFALLLLLMVLITLLTIVFAPAVAFIIAGGFVGETLENGQSKFELTVRLTQICASYSAFICLAALASGVLNTLRSFAIPAFAPVLLNVVTIVALIAASFLGASIHFLAWAVFLAGSLQLAVVWLACRKQGILLKPLLQWQRWLGLNTTLMQRLLVLMVPGVLAAAAQQIGILATRFIASSQDGAQSYLWYGDRVQQLPLGMIGIAMGTVLLPELSRNLSKGNYRQATSIFQQGFSFTSLLTIPAAFAFVALGPMIFEAIFMGGEFDTHDAQRSGEVLRYLSLGMPMWVLVKVLLPAYFAREDTLSPLIFSSIAIGVNILLAAMLFPLMQANGIALASSISGLANFALLLWGLRHNKVMRFEQSTWRKVGGILGASLSMALCLFIAHHFLDDFARQGIWQTRMALVLLISFGLCLYFALIYWGRIFSIAELKAAMKRPAS